MIEFDKDKNVYKIDGSFAAYIPKENFNKEDLRGMLHSIMDYGVYRSIIEEAKEKNYL